MEDNNKETLCSNQEINNSTDTTSEELPKKYIKEIALAKRYYENKKKRIILSNGLNKVISALWIIFGGLWSSFLSIILGASYCLTIIGIPLGIIYFKSIKLIISPINKRVVLKYGKHPILNTLWLIFGGLEVSLIYLIIGVVCELTIILTPLGKQMYKFAKFYFAPFGAEIIHKYEFENTEDKNVIYTYQYLLRNDPESRKKVLTIPNAQTEFNVNSRMTIMAKDEYGVRIFDYTKRIVVIYCLLIPALLMAIIYLIGFNIFTPVIGHPMLSVEYELGIGIFGRVFLNIFIFYFLLGILSFPFSLKVANAEFYGYINVTNAVKYKIKNKQIRKNLLDYYYSHEDDINNFIKQEYIY